MLFSHFPFQFIEAAKLWTWEKRLHRRIFWSVNRFYVFVLSTHTDWTRGQRAVVTKPRFNGVPDSK